MRRIWFALAVTLLAAPLGCEDEAERKKEQERQAYVQQRNAERLACEMSYIKGVYHWCQTHCTSSAQCPHVGSHPGIPISLLSCSKSSKPSPATPSADDMVIQCRGACTL